MTEPAEHLRCKRCRYDDRPLRRVDSFDRIALADDPADANCGHYILETVYVMRCPGCDHQQEQISKRTPYTTLREAQKEMDAHFLGKG